MKKYFCNEKDCTHVSNDPGFCPKHGHALVEMKATEPDMSDEAKALLEGVAKQCEDAVSAAMKEYGFDKPAPNVGIDQNPTRTNIAERRKQANEVVEKLINMDLDCGIEGRQMAAKKDLADLERARDEGEKAEKAFFRKARTAYFFKNMVLFKMTSDPAYLSNVKALAEGTDEDGGYLVPDEFRAELIRDLKDQPFLRNYVRVVPMARQTMELPKLTTDVKTSWGTENAAIQTTTAAFGNLTWTAYRLNTMMYTSRELVADSAIAIVPLITELFREAIGREEDRVIINGSGSGQPKGILQETLSGIDNANVDANLAANLKKLPFRLGTRYRPGARWIMNSLAAEHISALKDDNGRFLMSEFTEGGVDQGRSLAGYPTHEQNDMPVDTILFGNLNHYILGDRERISIESTTEGAGTFEKHQVAIKVVERIDGKVTLTQAFRTLTNAGID